jgi:hypothetical protein
MENDRSVVREPDGSPLHPPRAAGRRRRRSRERRKKCPYCLLDLMEVEPAESSFLERMCPLCAHVLLDGLPATPLRQFTRIQKWDYLANEMEYIWDWEYRDLSSYRDTMGEFRNGDYTLEKDRLPLAAKNEVLKRRGKFLRAGGDPETGILEYLKGRKTGDGRLGRNILRGQKWRDRARLLSEGSPTEKQLRRFRLGLVKAAPWSAFGNMADYFGMAEYLGKKLEEVS